MRATTGWGGEEDSFFCNDTATTEIYTLSLHDALPICDPGGRRADVVGGAVDGGLGAHDATVRSSASVTAPASSARSEEHTSELQSRQYLVCRLLLEKKTINVFSFTSRLLLSRWFLLSH